MLLVLAMTASAAMLGATGAYSEVPPPEFAPGSHIASLAAFGLHAVKAQSNFLELQALDFGHVTSASSQLVAGTNYRVNIALEPQGTAMLTIFEGLPGSQTLEVTEARFTPTSASLAHLDLLAGNAVRLDVSEFTTFAETLTHHCTGGKVWKTCGSACERTCDVPIPACNRMCVQKCECPADHPLSKEGHCIKENQCEVEEPVGTRPGGHNDLPAEEYAAGSRLAHLASFALDAVKGQSNALDIQSRTFGQVTSASRQVVAGTNYRVTVALEPSGTASLMIFEGLPGSHTLEVSAATFSAASGMMGATHIDLLSGGALALNEAAFATFHAGLSSGMMGATLGQETPDEDAAAPSHPRAHVVAYIVLALVALGAAYYGARAMRARCSPNMKKRLVEIDTTKSHEMQVSNVA